MLIPGAQVKNDDHRRKGRFLYSLELHQENDRFNNKRGLFGYCIVCITVLFTDTQPIPDITSCFLHIRWWHCHHYTWLSSCVVGSLNSLIILFEGKIIVLIYFLSLYAKLILTNMSRYKPDNRTAFSRQPAHYLLFDVGHPMTSTQMRNTIMVFLP